MTFFVAFCTAYTIADVLRVGSQIARHLWSRR
jgi:hypothetical protein